MKSSVICIHLILAFCATLSAQTVTYEAMPDAFNLRDMSPDGRWIVGNTNPTDGAFLYDCETKLMTMLPAPSEAVAVSDDGSIVLGNIDEDGSGGNGPTAGIWRQSTGLWESLGFLPNALNCPSRSSAYELSGDGTKATGLSWDGCSGRGFLWTQGIGMEELEPLANGGNRSSAMSADGSVFGGFAQGSFNRTPAFWRADLTGELLDPPDGDVVGEVHAFSDDGSVMLGTWASDASRWTFNGASWDRETIGNGSIASSWTGIPADIANDGTIVGFDTLQTSRRAWIQPQGQGELLDLRTWAIDHGAVIPGGEALGICEAISADGTKIIGHTFFAGSYILTITPDILLGDVNLDGVVTLLDVDPFVSLLIAGDFQAEADINGDGKVSLLDVDPFVAILSAG